jgi:hypothetical protein
MGVEEGGYLTNPSAEQAKVEAVVQAAIDQGIYVIIDWHDHNAHQHTDKAVEFFSAISKKYAGVPNVLYEIYNEPLQVSWTGDIKPYHEKVGTLFRKYPGSRKIFRLSPQSAPTIPRTLLFWALQLGHKTWTLHRKVQLQELILCTLFITMPPLTSNLFVTKQLLL